MYSETEGKTIHLGVLAELNIKMLYLKSIIENEANGLKGQVFLHTNKSYFRPEV
jgi:hypothetical protein